MNIFGWIIEKINQFAFWKFILLRLLKMIRTNIKLISSIATISGIIITLFAVLVALFQEKIKYWHTKPELIVSVMQHPMVDLQSTNSKKTIHFQYIFLKIENQGLTTARNVKCSATRYSKEEIDSSVDARLFWFPIQLPWAVEKFGYAKTNSTDLLIDVFPNETRILCFLCVKTQKNNQKQLFLMNKGVVFDYDDSKEIDHLKEKYKDKIFLELYIHAENTITNPEIFEINIGDELLDFEINKI